MRGSCRHAEGHTFLATSTTDGLWAITPEGRPRNLGEVQFTGEDVRKQVTTELQAFALIVTAEPYFAVTQPSDVVVIENSVRPDTRGRAETVQAKYELLPRGSYLMNRPSEFTKKPLEPGCRPIWPRRAMQLNSPASLARTAMRQTRSQRRRACWPKRKRLAETPIERRGDRVRPSVRTDRRGRPADRGERQDVEFTAQQKALADDRGRQAFEERLRADREELKAAQAKADAEREAQAAAQAKATAERETQNAAQATAEFERERNDTARVQDELQQARLETLKAQAAVAVAEQEKNALREQLREQLNMFLETQRVRTRPHHDGARRPLRNRQRAPHQRRSRKTRQGLRHPRRATGSPHRDRRTHR